MLIFVTGIREYALEAFDVAAFHYLLKPIGEKKLLEVLERAVREVEKRKGCRQEQLVFKTRKRSVTMNPEQILYLENRGKKAGNPYGGNGRRQGHRNICRYG